MPAQKTIFEEMQQLRAEAWEEIRKIDRPIKLSLAPGTPDTPEIREWLERVEAEMNKQAKDPHSHLTRAIVQSIYEDAP